MNYLNIPPETIKMYNLKMVHASKIGYSTSNETIYECSEFSVFPVYFGASEMGKNLVTCYYNDAEVGLIKFAFSAQMFPDKKFIKEIVPQQIQRCIHNINKHNKCISIAEAVNIGKYNASSYDLRLHKSVV